MSRRPSRRDYSPEKMEALREIESKLEALFATAGELADSLIEMGLGNREPRGERYSEQLAVAIQRAFDQKSVHPVVAANALSEALRTYRDPILQAGSSLRTINRNALRTTFSTLVENIQDLGQEYLKIEATDLPTILTTAQSLRQVVPDQRPAPLRFRLEGEVLRLHHVGADGDETTAAATTAARDALLTNGARLLEELRQTNCDRRVSAFVEDVQKLLRSEQDVVALGIASIAMDLMRDEVAAEMPNSILAMMKGYSSGIGMYLSQFPEWAEFAGNAAALQVSSEEVAEVVAAAESTIGALVAAGPTVDPEVPGKLGLLVALARRSGEFGKRPFLALVRSLGNLTSAIARHCGDTGSRSLEKTKDGVAEAAKVIVKYGLIMVAITAGVSILPVSASLKDVAWVPVALDLLRKLIKSEGDDK